MGVFHWTMTTLSFQPWAIAGTLVAAPLGQVIHAHTFLWPVVSGQVISFGPYACFGSVQGGIRSRTRLSFSSETLVDPMVLAFLGVFGGAPASSVQFYVAGWSLKGGGLFRAWV